MYRAALLAFLSILSLALSPAGYMPMVDADGRFVLQICPGVSSSPASDAADTTSHVAMADGAVPQDLGHDMPHDEMVDSPCDYATTGAANLSDGSPLIAAQKPVFFYQRRNIAVLTGIFPQGLPPSTGPPSA